MSEDRYGNTKIAKIKAAYDDLRSAVRSGDNEAAQTALDRYEQWADFAFTPRTDLSQASVAAALEAAAARCDSHARHEVGREAVMLKSHAAYFRSMITPDQRTALQAAIDAAKAEARAVKPQGYAEGLEAAVLKHLTWFERFICDRDELDSSTPRKVAENAKDAAVELRQALAARPAPQPEHDSDCATHNMPASPAGPCDCSLYAPQPAAWAWDADGFLQPAADTRVVVKPLLWEGNETDCYVSCDMRSVSYELIVSDTLERSCDYVWAATYHDGKSPAIPLGNGTFLEAQAAAQTHHEARILSYIIGNATPAPSDKIAEAARDGITGFGASYWRDDDCWVIYSLPGAAPFARMAGFDNSDVEWTLGALRRALAGQGATP